MSDTINVHLKFSPAQVTALDTFRARLEREHGFRVSRSQAIRDIIGQRLGAAGIEWPDDPKQGGDMKTKSVFRDMWSDRPSHDQAAMLFFRDNPKEEFIKTDGTMESVIWRRVGHFVVAGDRRTTLQGKPVWVPRGKPGDRWIVRL